MSKGRAALLVIDVQNDFCPGGALAVKGGNEIVPILNEYIERFSRLGLPVYASRDWHPEKTSHFKEYGGPWPPHCVAGTSGAAFHPDLRITESTIIVSGGTQQDEDGYSAFQAHDEGGTSLSESLREHGVREVFVGGIATDYCVRASVLDAIKEGFGVFLLEDAVRGVEVRPGDSERALKEMIQNGARTISLATLDEELSRKV